MQIDPAEINAALESINAREVLTASDDGTARVWDARPFAPVLTEDREGQPGR